jgi:peptidoglycan/LPS O-acetylase OafA/YrhL
MVFPLVDLVRAFAALTVLVYHLVAHWDWSEFPTSGPLAWFRGGWMAVDLFFVVSGFVVGLSAFARVREQGADFRGAFLRSRLARIVPLHYLTLAVHVLLVEPSLRGQAGFGANLLAHLGFVHNLVLPYHGAINGPNWSLGAEMQFYLLVAFAAPWLLRVPPWRLLLVFVAVAWAWRWGTWALWLPGPLDAAYYAQTQLPSMLDEFAAGLLLARFVRAPSGQALLARIGADARVRWAFVLLAALYWWALFTLHQHHDFWEQPLMAVFFRTGLAAGAALVLLPLCGWPMRARGPLLAAALYLGRISYGIYLWHLPVLFLLGRHTQLAPVHALAIAVPATIALAAVTWHCFERPLLARWGRRADRPAAATMMAA